MSDVLIVIPARYGSARLPGKPLADLGGKPLIGRVLERLNGLTGTTCVVATDDQRIAAVVAKLGGTPELTSSRCRAGLERVAEVAMKRPAPVVVNVQGDEAFVEPEAVAGLIDAMRQDAGLQLATLACPLVELERWKDPSVVKVVVDRHDLALYFSRAPIPWPRDKVGVPAGALQHLGVYAYRRSVLLRLAASPRVPLEKLEDLEQLRALVLGIPIRVLRVRGPWQAVDTEQDLFVARDRLAREEGG